MAKRSTRNRIKFQASKIPEHIDRIEECLQAIDEMADGRSEWVNTNMPGLIKMSEMYREAMLRFTDRL